MPPSSRIPPLLQPYVDLPSDESVLLLTSTLGASANWLTIRFLCDALSNAPGGVEDERHNVVLVSWMREYEFWKQESRKGAGLDLERLKKEGRFAFVDGLSGLFLEATDGPAGRAQDAISKPQNQAPGAIKNAAGLPEQRGAQSLPSRGPPGRISARGPPAAQPTRPAPPTSTAPPATSSKHTTPGQYALSTPDLAHVKATLSSAISALTSTPQRKTLVVIDNPDLLLALHPTISAPELTSLFLALHMLPSVSHVLLHMQSDTPLLSLSTPPQPLELAQHNLLVKTAHMSRRILGVRVLDTGVARDVSGVVRVTEHSVGWMGLGLEGESHGAGVDEKGREFLYQVKGDGSVKVFERGAGGEG